MSWVIWNNDERGYWSNEWGWTSLDEADVFTEYERGHLNLPLDGEWKPLGEAD